MELLINAKFHPVQQGRDGISPRQNGADMSDGLKYTYMCT